MYIILTASEFFDAKLAFNEKIAGCPYPYPNIHLLYIDLNLANLTFEQSYEWLLFLDFSVELPLFLIILGPLL